MDNNDKTLLSDLDSLRVDKGWSQRDVSQKLGISQGHISKVLGHKVRISLKIRAKIRSLLAEDNKVKASDTMLEGNLIAAVRTSSAFRALIRAALEMHKDASNSMSGRLDDAP